MFADCPVMICRVNITFFFCIYSFFILMCMRMCARLPMPLSRKMRCIFYPVAVVTILKILVTKIVKCMFVIRCLSTVVFWVLGLIHLTLVFLSQLTVSCWKSCRKALVWEEQAYISCFKMGGTVFLSSIVHMLIFIFFCLIT